MVSLGFSGALEFATGVDKSGIVDMRLQTDTSMMTPIGPPSTGMFAIQPTGSHSDDRITLLLF